MDVRNESSSLVVQILFLMSETQTSCRSIREIRKNSYNRKTLTVDLLRCELALLCRFLPVHEWGPAARGGCQPKGAYSGDHAASYGTVDPSRQAREYGCRL
jgi:hypothetical protein